MRKLQKIKNISPKQAAVYIFAAVLLWVVSGVLFGGDSRQIEQVGERVVPSVVTKHSVAQEIERELVLYGVSEAVRKVVLKAEVSGKVDKIIAEEGSVIAEGESILSLDVKDRKARLAKAKALVGQRNIEYKTAKSLNQSGYQSAVKLAEAEANLNDAKAQLKAIEVEIDDLVIKAPFDGVLQDVKLEVGDLVTNGQAVATVIDNSSFLGVAQVPEQMVGKIKLGYEAMVATVTGVEAVGEVSYISNIADPLTRTFRVEVAFKNEGYNLQDGVTAQIDIAVEKVKGHLIPSSAFSLDEEGNIGVKVLAASGIVKFYPVDIVRESSDGVWIVGLPEQADIITKGQAFLRDGDKAVVSEG